MLEFRDKSIRNELDVEAALQLPMLVGVPWVGETQSSNGKKYPEATRATNGRKETVEV
jgi:hypothetical protein